jgi:hypothetical protein
MGRENTCSRNPKHINKHSCVRQRWKELGNNNNNNNIMFGSVARFGAAATGIVCRIDQKKKKKNREANNTC